MKKVVLFAGALMISAIGFSQVSSAPTSGTAAALPFSASGANTGLSIQNGTDNRVRVRQAGTEQSVLSDQNNGTGSGGNLAIIGQTGAVSAASGFQNAAEVNQSGTENQSRTRQQGDLNNAITNQGQNDLASSGNKARIKQGNADQAESNFAAIDQDGKDNHSNTLQTYDNNDAWTTQIGEENENMIVQNGGPNGTTGHEARVIQEGRRNESGVMQSGTGARNSATAEQIGNDNKAKQLQTTTGMAGSGNGNDASILQGAFFPPSVGAKAIQTQSGTNQTAGIIQEGGSVGSSNYAEQEQTGDGNIAGIAQGHLGGTNDNYAKQAQNGNNNISGLAQLGSGNKAFETQNGDDNISGTIQIGADNMLNLHQIGDGSIGAISQFGDSNQALLVQHDGQSYGIGQGVFSPASGNQADVLQMGPNGDLTTGGIDCTWDAQLDLDMDYSIPSFNLADICPDCP